MAASPEAELSNVAADVRDTLRRIQKSLECPICLELLSDPYTTQCNHPYCRACICKVISSTKRAKCPLCKEHISKRSLNENSRLGDIVEAVKALEIAIVKDTTPHSTAPGNTLVEKSSGKSADTPTNTLSQKAASRKLSRAGSVESRVDQTPMLSEAVPGVFSPPKPTPLHRAGDHHGTGSVQRGGSSRSLARKPSKRVRFAAAQKSSLSRKNISESEEKENHDAALLEALERGDLACVVRKRASAVPRPSKSAKRSNLPTHSVDLKDKADLALGSFEDRANLPAHSNDKNDLPTHSGNTEEDKADKHSGIAGNTDLSTHSTSIEDNPAHSVDSTDFPAHSGTERKASSTSDNPPQDIGGSTAAEAISVATAVLGCGTLLARETPMVHTPSSSSSSHDMGLAGYGSPSVGGKDTCQVSMSVGVRCVNERVEVSVSPAPEEGKVDGVERANEPTCLNDANTPIVDSRERVENEDCGTLEADWHLASTTPPPPPPPPSPRRAADDNEDERVCETQQCSQCQWQGICGGPLGIAGAAFPHSYLPPSTSSSVGSRVSVSPVIPLQEKRALHECRGVLDRQIDLQRTQGGTQTVPLKEDEVLHSSLPSPSPSLATQDKPGQSSSMQQAEAVVGVADSQLTLSSAVTRIAETQFTAAADASLVTVSCAAADSTCVARDEILTQPSNSPGGSNGHTTVAGVDSKAGGLDAASDSHPEATGSMCCKAVSQLDSVHSVTQLGLVRQPLDSMSCQAQAPEAVGLACCSSQPDENKATLGSVDQEQTLGSVDQEQTLGSVDQEQTLGSVDQEQALGSVDQEQTLGSVDREQTLGSVDREQTLGSVDREQTLGSVDREQTLGSVDREQTLCSVDQEQTLGSVEQAQQSLMQKGDTGSPDPGGKLPSHSTTAQEAPVDSTSLPRSADPSGVGAKRMRMRMSPLGSHLAATSSASLDNNGSVECVTVVPDSLVNAESLHTFISASTSTAAGAGENGKDILSSGSQEVCHSSRCILLSPEPDITTQEVGELQLRVEEKEREIMELEAALRARKKRACEEDSSQLPEPSADAKSKRKRRTLAPKEDLLERKKPKHSLLFSNDDVFQTESPPTVAVEELSLGHPFLSVSTSSPPPRQTTCCADASLPAALPTPTPSPSPTCLQAAAIPSSYANGSDVSLLHIGVEGRNDACITTSPARSPIHCSLSFVGSGLSKTQLQQLKALAKKHSGRLTACFGSSTSHVIVNADGNGCCPRTAKYLFGVAGGRWIVDYKWVEDSLEESQLLSEEVYEIKGDQIFGDNGIPTHARTQCSKVFDGCHIALDGEFSIMTQEQLSNLIRLGGGSVCALENGPRSPETQSNSSNNQTILHCPSSSSSSRQQKRKTFVVSDQPSLEGALNLVALHGSTPGVGAGARCDGGAVIVFSCWLLDCISEYKLLPVIGYERQHSMDKLQC